MALWRPWGGGLFLKSEVPLYRARSSCLTHASTCLQNYNSNPPRIAPVSHSLMFPQRGQVLQNYDHRSNSTQPRIARLSRSLMCFHREEKCCTHAQV